MLCAKPVESPTSRFEHDCMLIYIPGSICPGGDLVEALPGFYIVNKNPLKVLGCPHAAHCLGGMDSKCLQGYEGQLCETCAKGVDPNSSSGKKKNVVITCKGVTDYCDRYVHRQETCCH